MLVTRLTIAVSLLVSAFASLLIGYAFTVLSANLHPWGALVFIPVALGFAGVLGFLLALHGEPADKSANSLRVENTLLLVGISGALIFLLAAGWIVLVLLPGALLAVWYLSFCLFPLMPMWVAVGIVMRNRRQLRRSEPSAGMLHKQTAFIALIVCLMLPALRIGVQEAVMAWYGRDLANAARMSAEAIAGGDRYCVIDHYGALTFEDMDKRRILTDAIQKRFGFPGFNTTSVSAHFGIGVRGQTYWWSLREREFLAFPPWKDPMLRSANCPLSGSPELPDAQSPHIM